MSRVAEMDDKAFLFSILREAFGTLPTGSRLAQYTGDYLGRYPLNLCSRALRGELLEAELEGRLVVGCRKPSCSGRHKKWAHHLFCCKRRLRLLDELDAVKQVFVRRLNQANFAALSLRKPRPLLGFQPLIGDAASPPGAIVPSATARARSSPGQAALAKHKLNAPPPSPWGVAPVACVFCGLHTFTDPVALEAHLLLCVQNSPVSALARALPPPPHLLAPRPLVPQLPRRCARGHASSTPRCEACALEDARPRRPGATPLQRAAAPAPPWTTVDKETLICSACCSVLDEASLRRAASKRAVSTRLLCSQCVLQCAAAGLGAPRPAPQQQALKSPVHLLGPFERAAVNALSEINRSPAPLPAARPPPGSNVDVLLRVLNAPRKPAPAKFCI
mmetsp:Transcript_14327/g.45180  ORF Transcript_14327/g.45180 Transcript_14327/m.45180 type:complete len:391 (+) Transcript_14327:92-1264(+)